MSGDNSNASKASSGGVGLSGLFGVAFVVLKLCGVIDWSWWWVLAPFWLPVAAALAVALICLLVALAVALIGRVLGR